MWRGVGGIKQQDERACFGVDFEKLRSRVDWSSPLVTDAIEEIEKVLNG